MTNVLQKEFNLEETNKKYADGGDPTVVIIREATTEENKSREDFLNAKISENIDFIRNRNKDSKNRDWYDFRMQDEKYIDDTHSRLSLVEYRLRDEIALYEIAVTLAACNLVGHDGKTPY